MSSNSPQPTSPGPNTRASVLRLNNDVLYYIFKLNADMFSYEDALSNTRKVSQVCQGWRNIILGSPSMWGRLLDFDSLRWSSDNWQNEVLRRSGSSSTLWIRFRSMTAFERSKFRTFFFSILDAYWSRIEKLVVVMDVDKSGLEPWRAIYTPAPHLRVLDLELYDLKGVKNPSLNPLFDHNAPLLRTFHVIHLKFATHAPWLAGIRSLQIGYPFTATELLNVLTMTPLLENLCVYNLSEKEQGALATHPTQISLPNLNHVVLWLDVIMSGAFLECIIPGRGCSLSIRASRIGQASTTPNNLSKTFQTLSKYAQDFSNVHTPPFVSITIFSSAFYYKMMENSESKSSLEFSISIKVSYMEDLSMQKIATILNILIMPTTFKRTTELELELFDPPTADLNLATSSNYKKRIQIIFSSLISKSLR
ncbi:hypothetical protein BYT27DRAFT_6749923 [Phlegmacium glaucopus]|nr:hypothetical protein BYT27DRAFT_6749923 [Phlegmacium glaucopus]